MHAVTTNRILYMAVLAPEQRLQNVPCIWWVGILWVVSIVGLAALVTKFAVFTCMTGFVLMNAGAFISARNFGFQLRSQLFSLVAMILSLWGVLQLNSVGKLELSWIWGAYALHLITRLLVSFSWLAANMRFFRYIGKRKSGKLPDPFVFHE